jgi:LysM repeat protein
VNYLQKIVSFFALAIVLSSGIIAAEEMIHVVGKGETIYSISRFYRVSPEELMKANGITDPSRLQTGKRLAIPSSAFPDVSVSSVPVSFSETTSASAGAQVLTDYRVVKGDTLYSIARANGIGLQALLDMNGFSPNHVIKVGDTIKVSGRNTAVAQNNKAASNSAASGSQSAVLSLRWPVNARDVSYMTGQMGVIVEGESFEAVKSLTQGKVISAGPWRKFGKVAIVEAAGGYFYMYGGCESLSVKVGDRISVGAELGKLGVNSVSEKPQLFFMGFRNDTPSDPAKAPRAGGNVKT